MASTSRVLIFTLIYSCFYITNYYYSEDVLANEAISTGGWHKLVHDDMTCQDALEMISSTNYD